MTDRSTGPRCGNDPRAQLTDGDRQAVADFKARLALQAAAKPYIDRAMWTDGDPLMEVIAVTLWERCARDDQEMPQAVCDDPRTIAAFAAAVVQAYTEMQPPVDRAALRDRIAEAMREHYLSTNRDEADADRNMPCRCGDWREPGAEVDDENDWDAHLADAVLAVLPEPADQTGEFELRGDTEARAATLREVEQHVRQLARATFQPYYRSAYATLADDISRLADETPATEPADRAAVLLPAWEAVYEPGNVSTYLIGYANDQDAATGMAEAWLRSQAEVTGRLEWVDEQQMATGRHDRWFELIERHDGGVDTGPGIVVRRMADETQPAETQPDTCRSIVVDGQTISVRGSGVPAELDLAFFGEVVRAAKRRYAAEHPEPAVETVRPKREQPVYLSTPCAVCTHPYNWHCGRSACEFGTEENPCGCRSFTPGEEPAAGARQDEAQP